jgi:hypothetical protein
MNPRLNTIDLVVEGLEAAMPFHARLGPEFKPDPHAPGHAGCDLPNGTHVMPDAESLRAPALPGWTAPRGGPRTLLCSEFDTPEEVDATYAGPTGAGYRGMADPFDAFRGMRYATVADLDGNGIDRYAALGEVS